MPSQDVITRDNVTVKVNAVVYFRVIDPLKAIIEVRDYYSATQLLAQTTLRSVCGQVELDDLLAEREKVNAQLAEILDKQTEPWGIKVTLVEVRSIDLPIEMQRAIARQAEAERERRAKVINADGEFQAAKMADAARVLATEPMSLQLRYLQTLREIAAEKNSTLVMPVPVELLRFFEKMAPGPSHPEHEPPAEIEDLGDAEVAAAEAAISNVHVPELEEGSIPPAPEVENVVTPEVREVTAPDLAGQDAAAKDGA